MEVVQFTPEVILCDPWTADVISQHNRDVICQGCLRAVDDSLKYDISIVLLDLGRIREGAVKQSIWKSRRDSGAKECPAFLEKPDHVIVHLRAVLYGINPVFQSHAHTLG